MRFSLALAIVLAGTVPALAQGALPQLKTLPQANAPSVNASGTLLNAGDTVTLGVDGMCTGIVQTGGGWTGTVVDEASADGGATWTVVSMIPYGGGAATSSPIAAGLYEMAVGGLTSERVRAVTAITSGPAAIGLRATSGCKSLRVGNPSSNPLTTTDPNNGSYQQAGTAVASGTLPAPSGGLRRGVQYDCNSTTPANSRATLTLPDSSTLTWLVVANATSDRGVAATAVSAVTGCTFQSLF